MYLTYTKNELLCKENENYRLMQSNCAQQTIRVLDQAFKSFFSLLKLAKDGKRDYKKINEVKITAKCYEVEAEDLHLNQENSLAIDIGLDNLATCVSNAGTSFIMDGRKIKSINQRWNKHKAKLQRIDLGKRTNQQFVQLSFGKLRSQLKCLCERYSMKYVEQEESYTSKASFLDLDEIPTYQADNQEKHNFSGKRIYRGLYRSKEGKILNADVNGAANILRKSKQRLNLERLCRGFLDNPLRIRL